MMKFEKLSLVLAASVLMAACGGGGGDSGASPFNGGSGTSTGGSSSTGGSGDVPGTDVASAASAMSFVSVLPSSDPLLIQGATAQGRTDTGVLKFRVVDQVGAGVPNETVNFTVTPAANVKLNIASAVTDKDGYVSTSVTSKSIPTTVVVTAVLSSSAAIRAVSNALNISGGDPVQEAFQIVTTKFNLDGRMVGDKVAISAYVGDVNGNPVPDGFTINFTTDEGNIDGGCSTLNGACSVDFRVQAPLSTGLATITATGVTGDVTLTDTLQLNLAAAASSYRLTASQNTTTAVSTTALSSCKQQVTYYLNDGSGRAAAAGSTVTVANINNGATATVKYGSPVLDSLVLTPTDVVVEYDLTNLTGARDCQFPSENETSDITAKLVLKTPNGVQWTQDITLQYKYVAAP